MCAQKAALFSPGTAGKKVLLRTALTLASRTAFFWESSIDDLEFFRSSPRAYSVTWLCLEDSAARRWSARFFLSPPFFPLSSQEDKNTRDEDGWCFC